MKIKHCLLFFFLVSSALSQTVYYDTEHWVYDFLNRMDQKGNISLPLLRTLPLTRSEIADYLVQVAKHDLNSVEQHQLSYLEIEFCEELGKYPDRKPSQPSAITMFLHTDLLNWLPDVVYANGRNLLTIKSGSLRLYFDPIFRRDRMIAIADTLQKTERVFENSNGLALWGTIGSHVGFVSNIRDSRQWGTRKYPGNINISADGLGFAQGGPDYLEHDETIAYIVVNWDNLILQFGKDKNKWGPGAFGQLAFSTEPTSYDQIKLQYYTDYLKFTFLLAQLQHYNDYRYFYGERKSKILASHRLEFSPFKNFSFSVFETMIHAGKSIEVAYLNPLMFFRSADHYLGDQDNAGMGADFSVRLPFRGRVYGELYIDDMSTRKLGTGFYANRYAYTVGMDKADLFGLDNLGFSLEYTRIRPFTYSHERDIDYRHFTTNLGHWIGPNSDFLAMKASYHFSQPLSFELSIGQSRHGGNPNGKNVGGDILKPWGGESEPQNVEFLEGVLYKTVIIETGIQYEPLRNLYLNAEYAHYYDSIKRAKRNEFFLMISFNP